MQVAVSCSAEHFAVRSLLSTLHISAIYVALLLAFTSRNSKIKGRNCWLQDRSQRAKHFCSGGDAPRGEQLAALAVLGRLRLQPLPHVAQRRRDERAPRLASAHAHQHLRQAFD